LFAVYVTRGQDSHYWTEQYGTRSMLLSNSVVGSVEDLGAVYYNPGRLSLIKNKALLLSAKIYQMLGVKYKDITGEGTSSSSSNFGGVPSLLAGTFRIKKLPDHNFAYSFLVRGSADNRFTSRYDEDIPDSISDYLDFDGILSMKKKFKEEWAGLTWSYPIHPHVGIGLTTFFTTRYESAYTDLELDAYSDSGQVHIYENYKRYSYSNYGLVWKAGISMEYSRFRFGITVTTPTLSFYGDGTFDYRNVYTGIEDNPQPEYNIFHQSGIDLKYRSAWSVAGGLSATLFKGTINISGEYFGKVKYYTLLASDEFSDIITGEDHQFTLFNELNPVFNVGIGYDFKFNDKISTYLSYSTNNSAAISPGDNYDEDVFDLQASTFYANINNFGYGVVMNFNETNVTLGVTYAYAKFNMDRPVDFPYDTNTKVISDSEDCSEISWQRWRFIVGISIPFLKDVAQKMENNWEQKRKEKRGKKKDDN